MVTFSAMTARLVEAKGQVPHATYCVLVRETVERGRPVAYRAAPLDFSDLALRLESAIALR